MRVQRLAASAALGTIVLAMPLMAEGAGRVQAGSSNNGDLGIRGTQAVGHGVLPNFSATGNTLVRLRAGAFDPLSSPAPSPAGIPPVSELTLPGGTPLYFLVQVGGGRFGAASAAIGAAGASIQGYIPDATYVVRATTAQRSQIASSAAVRWTGYLQPAWRVPVAASGLPALISLAGGRTYRVYSFRTDPAALTLASALRSIPGVMVVSDGRVTVDVVASATQLPAIASIPFVQWVTSKPIAVPLNYDARWVIDTGVRDLFSATAPNGIAPTRLNGAGVTAADADTPLNYTNNSAGIAHIAFRDGCDVNGQNCKVADYTQTQSGNSNANMESVQANNGTAPHRKMSAYFDVGGSGVENLDGDSHGSHTAGTVDGDAAPYAVYNGQDGLAPAAHHVHQEIMTPSGSLATPTDYYELFRQAYKPSNPTLPCASTAASCPPDPLLLGGANFDSLHDARTHNNSYGLIVPEVDPFTEAIALDQFVWDHEDMAIAVAAGNSGPKVGTIGSPAVAKNDFASAASSNGRLPMAAIDSITNFSSHGPTGDGRYGVTVADPGEVVVSVKGGTTDSYHYEQGTSMSTPVLTGALTLMRQYFWSGYGPNAGKGFAPGSASPSRTYDPSAALLKAAVVAGATRMRGWYSGDDGSTLEVQDRGQYPSDGQGFGLVNLDRSLSFAGGPLNSWFHDEYRLDPGAFDTPDSGITTRSYSINVATGAPLNVALAWTDAPDALPAGSPALVNDLQLTLTDPNGLTYVGNNYNTRSNPSAAVAQVPPGNAAPDTTNNVQKVTVAQPAAGTWKVNVAASQIAIGKQGFALAANGVIGPTSGTPVAGPPHQTDTVPGSPHIANVQATPVSADTVKLTFTTDEPTTASAIGTVTSTSHQFDDVYELTTGGYFGVDTPVVEDSPTYSGVPVLSTSHEIFLTGFSPGATRTFTVSAQDIEGSPPTTTPVTFTTPDNIFQPASSDQGLLAASNPSTFTWKTGKQFYAGHIPATTTAAADANLGAFMFRIPATFDPNSIVDAYVELQTGHDWASELSDDPVYTLDLLDNSVKPAWGTQTYSQIENAPRLARTNPETAFHLGTQRFSFAFTCNSLAALRTSLSAPLDAQGMRDVPFRWDATDTNTFALYSAEFGFNRRSHGVDLRPKLVLLTQNRNIPPPLSPCDPSTPAPTISSLGIHPGLAPNSWSVSWRTDVDSDSMVLFRPVGGSTFTQVASPGRSKVHQVQVFGINPSTNYEFGVRSTACNGNSTTDDNHGAGYAFVIPPVVTQAQTAPFYFHGTSSDDTNRQAGAPSALFNATAPVIGDPDVTQTGNPATTLSPPNNAGDPNAAYWIAHLPGAPLSLNGNMHLSWYWSTPNAAHAQQDITIWADPNLVTHTGTLLGSTNVNMLMGTGPTLNKITMSVNGSVADKLLIQVAPHFIVNDTQESVHYNSTATSSQFTLPIGTPPPPPNRPVVGPQPPASALDNGLNIGSVALDSPPTTADLAAGTSLCMATSQGPVVPEASAAALLPIIGAGAVIVVSLRRRRGRRRTLKAPG